METSAVTDFELDMQHK